MPTKNKVREEVISALERRDYDDLIELWIKENGVIRILISMTYNKDDIVAWRAIEAIGRITAVMAERQPDDVRNLAGRMLWMIRDESGGIGWSAPEIIGEIIRNNTELCYDLVPVLISFHEEQMLRAGVLWAAGRIAEVNRELILSAVPVIMSYLNDPDCNVRGMAIWAISRIRPEGYNVMIKDLISDDHVMVIYNNGELQNVRIGTLAEDVMRMVRENSLNH